MTAFSPLPLRKSPNNPVVKALKTLGKLDAEYPQELLHATKAGFIAQVKAKTERVPARPVGS